MIKDLNQILVEWSYRTSDGKPDVKNRAKLLILENVLNDFGWSREARAELLGTLMEAPENKPLSKQDREKIKKMGLIWKGQGYGKENEKGISFKNDDGKLVKVDKDTDDKKDGEKLDEPSEFDRDVDSNKGVSPDYERPKSSDDGDDSDMPDVDVDKLDHKGARAEVYPVIEKTAQKVEKLMSDGKQKEAQNLVKSLVKKYKLSKPLYLQPEKEGKEKIYVGSNYRYAWGSKNEGNKAQGKLVAMIEKSGATIPVRPGGISRVALSPQQVHTKRKVGTVKTNMEDGKILSKEVTIGKRSFTLKSDPNDPLSQMKLETLPDGEVEFCDINSADTPEGRTECIVNATNNMVDMFTKLENNISEEDEFNRGIAKKVKQDMLLLQKLENQKSKVSSDEEKEKLQSEFYEKCLDVLAETKQNNPTKGGSNEYTMMTAYMAETVEAIVLLNRGVETYIPSSANFKTSDVLSLRGSDIDQTAVSVDGRGAEYTIEGSSVKFAGGGASQMPNKNQNSTYKDNDVSITVGGKERKGTLDVLNGLTEYYGKLFPESDEAPKPLTDDELKKANEDNLNSLYEYYPEFKDNPKILEEVMGKCKNASEKQLARLNKTRMKEKSEGLENAQKRFELYHLNQWVAGMVYNHPERGMKSQSYSNSDYVVGSKGGKKYVKRVHSNGTDSVVYHGWDPDQGYSISKNGKIIPTNVYSSRMKHNNPADYWMKKVK